MLAQERNRLFGVDQLAAWCIVPYDGARRGPVARARMLADLGLRHLVWDWRDEHLASFGEELDALAHHGISLDAVWFPVRLRPEDDAGPGGHDDLDDVGHYLVAELSRRGLSPDLWVCTEFGAPGPVPALTPSEQAVQVARHAAAIAPAARAAAALGGRVGLYNHLGWFGEPENQLAVADALADRGYPGVGLVYNQHHGHAHLERFPELLEAIAPRLLALNLNGMVPGGDLDGHKIVPVGHGPFDLALLGAIGHTLGDPLRPWDGRIGIIGHTADDARDRLLDNLEGLAWAVERLGGRPGAEVGETPPPARIPAPELPDD